MEKGRVNGTSPAAYPTSFCTSHTSTAFTYDTRSTILFSASQRHLAWDIRSSDRPVVPDGGSFLAKVREMRVQSTRSMLRVRS